MSLVMRIIKIVVTLFVYLIAQTFVAASINSFFDLIPMKIDNLFDLKTYRILYERDRNVLDSSLPKLPYTSIDSSEKLDKDDPNKIELGNSRSNMSGFKDALKVASNDL